MLQVFCANNKNEIQFFMIVLFLLWQTNKLFTHRKLFSGSPQQNKMSFGPTC